MRSLTVVRFGVACWLPITLGITVVFSEINDILLLARFRVLP